MGCQIVAPQLNTILRTNVLHKTRKLFSGTAKVQVIVILGQLWRATVIPLSSESPNTPNDRPRATARKQSFSSHTSSSIFSLLRRY
jgi:hypothetical protein